MTRQEGHASASGSPALAPLAALAGLTLVRLLVAAAAPLSPDEAYYWVWSRALAPGYLDHPPMAALWIRLGTMICGDTALGVRLLAPFSAAAGSLMLARVGETLFPGRRVGLGAAALLNATLLFGAGGATMTPDTPLLFFWTATLFALAAWAREQRGIWIALAGLCAGLAMDSKYTAALLPAAALAWIAATPELRRGLRTPALWAGAALGGLAFAPVLAWNWAHDWASFARQGGRAASWAPAKGLRFVAELIAGQAGLATPVIFVVCLVGVVNAGRRWRGERSAADAFVVSFSALPALVFLQHALGDRVQANWPAIIYPAAALGGAALAGSVWRRCRRVGLALGLLLTFAAYVQAVWAPVPLPRGADPTMRELAGWPELAEQVARAVREREARFVAADNYGVAAELAWRLPPGFTVVGADARWSLFELPREGLSGQRGLLVRSARRRDDPEPGFWEAITPAGSAVRSRAGIVAETYNLYDVTGGAPALSTLPRPRLSGP